MGRLLFIYKVSVHLKIIVFVKKKNRIGNKLRIQMIGQVIMRDEG